MSHSWDLRILDLGDPVRAARELARVGADPAGVGKMRDKTGTLVLKIHGLKAPAANILKQEMLSVGGDAAVGRGVVNCSVERSDAVVFGTRKQLRALVRKLKPQPFGLRSLADEVQRAIAVEPPQVVLRWDGGALPLEQGPLVMGALNVTLDSFSDGGDYWDPERAAARALEMVQEGADLLDIGGESSRPGSDPVSEEEELRRVLPMVEYLVGRVSVPISVDTCRSGVARRAVAAGAALVNDISGFRADPEMAGAVADSGAAAVVMHMRGTPKTMQADTRYGDLLGEVWRGLRESLELGAAAGIPRERLAVDPGIGFGKSAAANLLLLQRLGEFATLGCAVLVGASRKAFIGKTLGIDDPRDRLEGSLAAATLAVWNGAQIVRAHDVRATRRAVGLAWAVRRAEEE